MTLARTGAFHILAHWLVPGEETSPATPAGKQKKKPSQPGTSLSVSHSGQAGDMPLSAMTVISKLRLPLSINFIILIFSQFLLLNPSTLTTHSPIKLPAIMLLKLLQFHLRRIILHQLLILQRTPSAGNLQLIHRPIANPG